MIQNDYKKTPPKKTLETKCRLRSLIIISLQRRIRPTGRFPQKPRLTIIYLIEPAPPTMYNVIWWDLRGCSRDEIVASRCKDLLEAAEVVIGEYASYQKGFSFA